MLYTCSTVDLPSACPSFFTVNRSRVLYVTVLLIFHTQIVPDPIKSTKLRISLSRAPHQCPKLHFQTLFPTQLHSLLKTKKATSISQFCSPLNFTLHRDSLNQTKKAGECLFHSFFVLSIYFRVCQHLGFEEWVHSNCRVFGGFGCLGFKFRVCLFCLLSLVVVSDLFTNF